MNKINKELKLDKDSSRIINYIETCGGKVYIVGGYVRDYFLQIKSKDIDLEVYGIYPNDLIKVLKLKYNIKVIGKFSVIKFLDYDNIELSFPRVEKSTGLKYTDFDILVDPYLDMMKACKRRDFTINALMYDVKNMVIIDFFGSIKDINNKVIRVVGVHFSEDPLRYYRMLRFSVILNFKIDPQTLIEAKKITTSQVAITRVEQEIIKCLESNNYYLLVEILTQKKTSKRYNYLETRIIELYIYCDFKLYEQKKYKKLINLYEKINSLNYQLQVVEIFKLKYDDAIKKELLSLICNISLKQYDLYFNIYTNYKNQYSAKNLLNSGIKNKDIRKIQNKKLEESFNFLLTK